MTSQDLPSRQKSQRLINRIKSSQQHQQFQQYKQRAKNINNVNELLPGLNDISDAIEALPMDLIKYFTLLKEIDAKCINTVPVINHQIKSYIENLHPKPINSLEENQETNQEEFTPMNNSNKFKRLTNIRNKIHEVIPCLEEKMHVTSVATDLLHKHLYRINNDYKLIINNNEIPESIRIGPLNHPAMIMDSSNTLDHSNPNRSAQSQRSESRREALAARKQNKDDDEEFLDKLSKKIKNKESTPEVKGKKRTRKELPIQSVQEGLAIAHAHSEPPAKKRATSKPKREIDPEQPTKPAGPIPTNTGGNGEPTYCYCNQVSFGEMVGCDGDDCKREWFHLPCIGFKNPPKGKWYCDDCLNKSRKVKKF
ncbi:hypothetical protein HYPBUDRAFT_143248 [Hyphopichia burtonii NRRL Y-1933]|uniref:Chromatin modification-related protein n=1 Tax=Hyphopichia burtonii NRRL Y-1933 TaxID=984485 RepID=A0A1E4RE90_9ASCO|nr:hypothetical protein HYPBUDRAFT_143248 [Hyphopichia burtonii NRRL Y-1933]ODV65560.1 hypothetical protein HYPBUDRAFT_143248 [Hyphopichia burtonii NRRL Y-1933]